MKVGKLVKIVNLLCAVAMIGAFCFSAIADDSTTDPNLFKDEFSTDHLSEADLISTNIAGDVYDIYKKFIYPNVDIYNDKEQDGIQQIFLAYLEKLAEADLLKDYAVKVDFDEDMYIQIWFLVNTEDAKWALIKIDKNKLPQLKNSKKVFAEVQ